MAVVRVAFKPEFLNRLDDIVFFHALDTEQLGADRRHPGRGAGPAARRPPADPRRHPGGPGVAGHRRVRPAVRGAPAAPADPVGDRRPAGQGAAGRPGPGRRHRRGRRRTTTTPARWSSGRPRRSRRSEPTARERGDARVPGPSSTDGPLAVSACPHGRGGGPPAAAVPGRRSAAPRPRSAPRGRRVAPSWPPSAGSSAIATRSHSPAPEPAGMSTMPVDTDSPSGSSATAMPTRWLTTADGSAVEITTNSSPPVRATIVSASASSARPSARCASSSSPAACPCRSLTCLKSSTSSATTARGRCRSTRANARSSPRRFARPVSGSSIDQRCRSSTVRSCQRRSW